LSCGFTAGPTGKTSLTGTEVGVDVTSAAKIWLAFQALGDIAFAYSYSMILIEIQVIKHCIRKFRVSDSMDLRMPILA
jgi:hypothetical protein